MKSSRYKIKIIKRKLIFTAITIMIMPFFVLNFNAFAENANLLQNNIIPVTKQNQNSATIQDTNPPHIPQGLSVKSLDKGLELSWNLNTKTDEVAKYLINIRTSIEKEDNDPIEVPNNINIYRIDKLANTFYFVSLQAKDQAGNKSKATSEIGIQPNQIGTNSFSVIGWMPLIDIEDQNKTLDNNFDTFTEISPFIYSLETDGSIKNHGDVLNSDIKGKLKDAGKKIIPTITNNFDDSNKGSNLVMDFRKRQNNIDSIVSLVKQNNFDGIDIDYENLDASVKDQYNEYIKILAKELHAIGKTLSVTLQAKQSDDESWTKAYDFETLGQSADQIRIMTYDHSRANTTPGPIAPIDWMAKAITYAQSKVDSSKLIVGIPFYAYDWCTEGKCDNRGLVWDGVKSIMDKYDITPQWDDNAKAPWFYYKDDAGNPHTVYFEDQRSIQEKIDLIRKLGVGGVAIWRIGNEDPGNFDSLKNIRDTEKNSVSNIKVTPLDGAINLSWDNPVDSNLKGDKILFNKEHSTQYSLNVFDKTDFEIPNLENDATYDISIVPLSMDALLNDSESITINSTPQIIATPTDLAFPNTINDLISTTRTDTSIGLQWTAAGDDYDQGLADSYDIRYSEQPIDQNNFYSATQYKSYPEPLIPPTLQEMQLNFLMPGTRYYIAIKTLDEEKNPSLISNVLVADTIDTVPPKVPSQPVASSSDKKVIISWDGNSEKDLAGYRLYYKQEKSFYKEIDLDSAKKSYTLDNLENNYHYFVALVAYDRSGNESARTKEIDVYPKADSFWQRINDGFGKGSEKLQASAMIFGKRLISPEAIPYLVMFSIVIINIFIFSGLKKEIHKKVKETVKQEQKKPILTTKQSSRSGVVDLRRK